MTTTSTNDVMHLVDLDYQLYIRSPTTEDVSILLTIGQQRGFPGMLGSLNCMHWKWKNCPTAWAGNNDINVLKSSNLFCKLAQGSSRYWKKDVLHDIMTSCIIMHNMIIEDERDVNAPIRDARPAPPANVEMTINEDMRFKKF
uniref:Uncharacterized protein n=1 Tax=Brassica oleracea var. oleracea TaxID=109376 RepID=A0A0D3AXL0_BRAOL